MKPHKNNVLVRPFLSDEKSTGGIIVPDHMRGMSSKVTIVAVGEGTAANPMRLKPDTIGFRVRDWGHEVEIEGAKHYLMGQEAIIATI